ncbi:helix-turn-helix transcriptional regulator [Chengkuizengella sediminis]|uniref:helix-turn-helix transcriptional regulator n=1 Tax=Chengkuizengella sediminis TaxID=1885917 RepID=UPI001389A1B7|nr:YafY family protein [Chengkuizengella sediminis]NDI35757.1 YafY family transcriptional regulator [Chengkuizengella sediminis]
MLMNRLFQIVYILLNKNQVTAKELSEKFEVSTRTIYRDVDKLSMAGIPIYTNKGKGGGISLLDHFILDKSVLSNEEQNKILIGLETLKATEYENVDQALLKLKALFNKSDKNWIEVDFSYWGSSKYEKYKFEKLKYALMNCRTIKFDYINIYGNKTERMVNPLKLLFKQKAWYLGGFCLLKNDYRIFKVHRIKNSEVTDRTFDREIYNPNELNITFEANKIEKPIHLKMTFTSNIKHRVFDEFESESIKELASGELEVNIVLNEDGWLYSYLISFGEDINIIEPKYINEILVGKLTKTIESYKKNL